MGVPLNGVGPWFFVLLLPHYHEVRNLLHLPAVVLENLVELSDHRLKPQVKLNLSPLN